MTNQKHPLEAKAVPDVNFTREDIRRVAKEHAHYGDTEDDLVIFGYDLLCAYKKALTTLREYIDNEEKVEGLAEALRYTDHIIASSTAGTLYEEHYAKILEAAKLQLKRQGE